MTAVIDVSAPRGSLIATASPGDPIDPISLFGAARAAGLDASLWHDPAAGRSIVGVDQAVRLTPAGPGRFERLAVAWRALAADIPVTGPASDSRLAGPILLGGATFRDHPSTDPRWAGLATAVFVVPRLLLVTHGDHAVVTVISSGGDGSSDAGPLERIVATLQDDPSPSLPMLTVVGQEPARPMWTSSVARITGAVGRGRLDKVVLARRVDLAADRWIDPVGVLRRLEAGDRADPSPGARLASTIFAFGHGARTFLGSTPERSASLSGRELRTMALAGTAPRGSDAAGDAAMGAGLLASEKDREEHAVVTAMLRQTLAPLVSELTLPRMPRVVRSARLHHLLTDATGILRPGLSLLDAVQRLHPTPAVGGWPTSAALDLLDEESTLDRGWYAGPVGWVDRVGDGEFAVAIRSGVLSGHEASLFAGCGIVADSEPDREWDESALKLRVMGDALGWDGE